MTIEFGKVEFVHLRDIWQYEAEDFTPWLADNLHYISDEIGIPLEALETEASVGRFSADILARDPDGNAALIENQLGRSDHTHLGQILTYLAGLQAKTVVWVASDFEEAHLSAIHWLNENTPADFSFFAVLVSAVRISGSPPAIQFNVVERQSDWDREIRAAAQPDRENLSPRGSFNRDFWTHHVDRHPEDRLKRGFAGYNPIFPVPGTEFVIKWFHEGRRQVGMCVAGPGGRYPHSVLAALSPYLPALEKELGVNPNQISGIALTQLDIDISNRANWQQAADWLHEHIEIYRRVLSQPPN